MRVERRLEVAVGDLPGRTSGCRSRPDTRRRTAGSCTGCSGPPPAIAISGRVARSSPRRTWCRRSCGSSARHRGLRLLTNLLRHRLCSPGRPARLTGRALGTSSAATPCARWIRSSGTDVDRARETPLPARGRPSAGPTTRRSPPGARRTPGRPRRRTSARRRRDAAPAAHARAVDHDRVEADDRLEVHRPRQLAHGAHHRQRADGDDLVEDVVLREECLRARR